MYRIFTLFIVLFATALVGCGGSTPQSTAPSSLVGTWKSADPPMAAHISSNTIQIDWVDDEALYWKGTMPTALTNGTKVVSAGDTKAMDESFLASLDTEKEFTYVDGKLTFSMSMLGVTRTVYLTR